LDADSEASIHLQGAYFRVCRYVYREVTKQTRKGREPCKVKKKTKTTHLFNGKISKLLL
jgi:hypothetical protein